MIEQTTVPGWVQNTLLLAEKLKYLVRKLKMNPYYPCYYYLSNAVQ